MNEKSIGVDCQVRRRDNEKKWMGIIGVFFMLSLLGLPASPAEREQASGKNIPRLTLEEAASLAQNTAKRTVGEKMNRYVLQEVEFQPKYGRWRASFEEKGPPYSFDGCFRIFVNDQTRETEFQSCP